MAIFGKTNWGRAHYSGYGEGQLGIEFSIADLGAFIRVANADTNDLSAEILTSMIKDLPAAVNAVAGEDLSASVSPIPSVDLPAQTFAIASVDLGATGGGHFPEDLPASMSITQPEDIPAEIRGFFGDTTDLGAAITQVGGFKDLSAYVKAAARQEADLGASMKVIAKGIKDLPASLQPFNEVDLMASLITERVFNMRAIVAGYAREVEANISAFLVLVQEDTADLGVEPLKAIVSTHTSDKLPNLDKVRTRFFENRYIFGTRSAGLALLTLEPIYGIFPDLHAEIFGQDFTRANLTAFMRAALPGSNDLGGQFTSVESFVNTSKLLLELVPLINMEAELIQAGGFLRMRANITGVTSSSTGTADDAGFITTAANYKFYLGTTKGVFIPPQIVSEVRIETFTNNFPRPDLHATIAGWNESNLGASISDYNFITLPASLTAWDLNHISHISASIGTFNTKDLAAFLTPSGAWEDITGQLNVKGQVSDITGVIVPAINPLAFNLVSISTKPFTDLGAVINYESFVRCSPTSVVTEISGYIKPVVTGTVDNQSDITATLTSRRGEEDLVATITSRKRTRIHLLNLTLTAKTRDSERVRGSITPVDSDVKNMLATIIGLSHEFNLPAEITPIRYAPHDVDFTPTETVANLESGDVKQVLVSFRSQVKDYIYDAIVESVFATDRGTWAIDVRSLIRDESFFDRSSLNREVLISGLTEVYSLDEALRQAFSLLCDRVQFNLGAQLEVRGAISDLGVQIGIVSSDVVRDLPSKIFPVVNSPDITAAINQGPGSSGLSAVSALLTPKNSEAEGQLGGFITGTITEDLGAEITVS